MFYKKNLQKSLQNNFKRKRKKETSEMNFAERVNP